MKSGESLEQGFLGSGGGNSPHRPRERAQEPGRARPSGLGATLHGRSLAPRRPQPGCELGLRRTLLAAPGRYSLCLSASAAAARMTCAFLISLAPKYRIPDSPPLTRESFVPLPLGAVGSQRAEKKERVRETHPERKKNGTSLQKLRKMEITLPPDSQSPR